MEEGVDTGRIVVENSPELGGSSVDACGGVPVDPERPHQPVGSDGCFAKHFRQSARAKTTLHVHLEQPVLGMHEAERHVEIMAVAGQDRRDAMGVAYHADRAFQSRQREAPGGLW